MATFWKLIVASFVVTLLVWPVGAATYFVAQEDPKASDDNNGSEATPYKTIFRSLKGLKSGDTVLIKKGLYREAVALSPTGREKFPAVPSGTSYQQMTTFAAFPGDVPVIKGSDVITGWKLDKGNVWYTESSPAPTAMPIIFCDDKRLDMLGDYGGTMSAMVKGGAGSVEVWKGKKDGKLADLKAGWYFYDKDSKRLYVWLPDGSDPNKHVMEITMRWGVSIEGSYLRVSGLKVLQASVGVGGSYNILENSESSDSSWCGGGVSGEFNTLVNCKFNRCGDSGMGGAGRGHRIINCETSYNNFLKIDAGWHSGGCKFISMCSGWVISGHKATGNIECPGIWFDWGNSDIVIENCVLDHNSGAIMIEVSERATIRNNICYENYGRGVYLSNTSDCHVYNNVFWHNGMSGVGAVGVPRGGGDWGDGKDGRLPARNNFIWGNVFVDNCHPDFCPKDLDGRDKPWDTRPELIMPDVHEINTGNVSDYNIYYRSPGRVMPFWKGWHPKDGIWDDMADWQKKTGNDMNSVIAEPKFVDAAKHDFRPAAGSVAIEFVKPRMGAQFDFYGKMRPTEERKDKKPLRFTAGPFEFNPDAK